MAKPLIVTLSNGATMTFAVGSTTATSEEFSINNGEDVYKDGSDFTITVLSVDEVNDGNFEKVAYENASAKVTVNDTITDVKLTLHNTTVVEADNGVATITGTLDHAPMAKPLIVTLSNGATMTFAVGSTTATSEEFSINNGEDVYKDGSDFTITVLSVDEVNDGNFEKVAYENASAKVTVNDTIDTTTLTLNDVNANIGDIVSITASLDHAPQTPLTVTLSNGATITFGTDYVAGTAVSSTSFAVTSDLATPIRVDSISGGNFENLVTTDVAIQTIPTVMEASVLSVSVSEEGLTHGLRDGNGIGDTTDDAVNYTGQIIVKDSASDTISITWDGAEANLPTGIKSGGVEVKWTVSGDGQTITGMADNIEVMKVEITGTTKSGDTTTASYTTTLLAPIDHPVNSVEDKLDINFKVNVSDGVNTTTTNVTVGVEDDMPSMPETITKAITSSMVDTNLMLVLDTSGSMAWGVKGKSDTSTSRMTYLKESAEELIKKYDELGDVKVSIVTFSATGSEKCYWLDATSAINIIKSLGAGGNTNYDAALAQAMETFKKAGGISGAQNKLYFISDAEPNRGDGKEGALENIDKSSDSGISDAEKGIWQDFLSNKNNSNGLGTIDSYAIGITAASSIDKLNPIASNEVAIKVENLSTLTQSLLDTIEVKGTIFDSSTPVAAYGFGADGGHIDSFTVGGVTYTYDAANPTKTATTSLGSTFKLNMNTGEYSYKAGSVSVAKEIVGIRVVDGDGDGVNTQLVLSKPDLHISVDTNATVHADGKYQTEIFGKAVGETVSNADKVDIYVDGVKKATVNVNDDGTYKYTYEATKQDSFVVEARMADSGLVATAKTAHITQEIFSFEGSNLHGTVYAGGYSVGNGQTDYTNKYITNANQLREFLEGNLNKPGDIQGDLHKYDKYQFATFEAKKVDFHNRGYVGQTIKGLNDFLNYKDNGVNIKFGEDSVSQAIKNGTMYARNDVVHLEGYVYLTKGVHVLKTTGVDDYVSFYITAPNGGTRQEILKIDSFTSADRYDAFEVAKNGFYKVDLLQCDIGTISTLKIELGQANLHGQTLEQYKNGQGVQGWPEIIGEYKVLGDLDADGNGKLLPPTAQTNVENIGANDSVEYVNGEFMVTKSVNIPDFDAIGHEVSSQEGVIADTNDINHNNYFDTEGKYAIDIKAGTGNDDVVLYDNLKSVDGGKGFDTLIVKTATMDFANIADKISNFEAIDLGKAGTTGNQDVKLTINAKSVLDITDNDKTFLKIFGDSKDKVNAADSWTKVTDATNQAEHGFTRYSSDTQANGKTVFIDIEDTITKTGGFH